MKRLISAIAAVFLAAAAGLAQPSVKVQAPNLVGLNEDFNITFIISGDDEPSDFSWEPGGDFQLVWGPTKGRSTQTTIVGGKRTRQSQTTYTYILRPKATGHFQLSAAEAVVKGGRLTSERPTVEVVADGAASGQGGSGGTSGGRQPGGVSPDGAVSSDDLFLRLIFSKKSAMVGETLTATLKLYQRVSIGGFENAKFPDFDGFWSQETYAPSNIEFQRESLDDKIYNTAVLRRWNLVPQKAGELTVDPAELVCLVNVRVPRASTGSIFDDFFQDDIQTIRKRITTAPVTIRVGRLPSGAPASFGGGVGDFDMKVELSRDSLLTHDAASLRIRVTGTGNVSLLSAPDVVFPADFETYDVKTSDIPGGKLFEYPFIPRSHGDFTVSPVEYAYYDISAGRYEVLKSSPLHIKVGKGKSDGASGDGALGRIEPGIARKDVRDVGSDIRFISTGLPSWTSRGRFFAGSALFWGLAALLAVLAAVLYFMLRSLASRRADVVGTRSRTAVKMAGRRLSQAGVFLKKDLYTAFYEELHRALLGYVSDKFNMDAADMSKENISSILSQAGVPDALSEDFIGLLDACEYARYAPDAGNEAMSAHYDKALGVISSIDDSMRRRHGSHNSGVAAMLALLLLVPAAAHASGGKEYADSLWTAGVQAYGEGRWSDAVDAWQKIESEGLVSAELYFNLGNAFFKNDDVAHAILNYARALKLDPSYSDARFNMEFAGTMVQDKIEAVPEFFASRWMRSLCWIMPSGTWAVAALLLFALALAMVLLFLLGGSTASRKAGFVTAIVALVLSLSSAGFAFWQRSDSLREDRAVVVRAVTTVKSSPSEGGAKDLFVLHEGTLVKLLDEVGEWKNIELSDGRQGWMLASDLEVI